MRTIGAFLRAVGFAFLCSLGMCNSSQEADLTSRAAVVNWPNDWPGDEMSIFQAVSAVAEKTTEPILLEAWCDAFIDELTTVGDRFEGLSSDTLILIGRRNPAGHSVMKPKTAMQASEALAHVIASHGKLTRLGTNPSGVVNLVRSEVLENPNWPLNKRLEISTTGTVITLGDAVKVLTEKYGLALPPPPYEFFRGKIARETVLGSVKSFSNATVRDLVNGIVKAAYEPGSEFWIIPLPAGGSSADYSSETEFTWSFLGD